jgi:Flp pilus assembly protein TadD
VGRYSQARTYYARLYALYPSDTTIKSGLAWALLKMGRASTAKRLFREILVLDADHEAAALGLKLIASSQ